MVRKLVLFIGLVSLSHSICYAQEFADKEYYLIDSLSLSSITETYREKINSSIATFYKLKVDSTRVKHIQDLGYSLPYKKIDLRYQKWSISYCDNKIAKLNDTLLKNKWIDIKGNALINMGVAHRKLGNHQKAIGYYNEAIQLFRETNNLPELSISLFNKALALHARGTTKEVLQALKEANILIEKRKDSIGIAHCNFLMGQVYYSNKLQIDSAIYYCERAIKVAKNIDPNEGSLNTFYSDLALYYKTKGDLNKATKTYFEALAFYDESDMTGGKATLLNNIAHLYENQGEFDLAKSYFIKGLEINQSIENKEGMAFSYSGLASILNGQKNIEASNEYHFKSLALRKEIGHYREVVLSLFNIGINYGTLKQFEQSKKYLDKSKKLSDSINYAFGQLISNRGLGEYYYNKKEFSKAKVYLEMATILAQEHNHPDEISKATKELSDIYAEENNWKEAYTTVVLHHKMKDSIRNADTERNVLKIKNEYELAQKQKEVDVLALNNELQALALKKKEQQVLFTTLGIVLLILILIIGYRSYKNKQKNNRLLKEQNEVKSSILKEIHHRVKNNLSIVNSLLHLQSRTLTDKKDIAVFQEAQSRVVSMALLHEKLYRTDDLRYIDINDHLSVLIEDLIEAYALNKEIRLDMEITAENLDINELVPLGLLINEIITNSLKHAFTEKEEGTIIVKLSQTPQNDFELIIGDDGIGIDDDEQPSEGIGKRLITTFIKQLDAVIERVEGAGTLYRIAFSSNKH